MAPAALAYTYCSADDLDSMLSVDGTTGRADDDASGDLSAAELTYVTAAITWATARVNFFLLGKYAASDLSESWIVNQWCIVCAAHWLSCRRGNPSPGSVDELYKEAMEDMKLVRSGEVVLPDTALRDVAWPAWSNVRVDQFYSLRKIRVERPISEKSPTPGYVQNRDIGADIIIEPN